MREGWGLEVGGWGLEVGGWELHSRASPLLETKTDFWKIPAFSVFVSKSQTTLQTETVFILRCTIELSQNYAYSTEF